MEPISLASMLIDICLTSLLVILWWFYRQRDADSKQALKDLKESSEKTLEDYKNEMAKTIVLLFTKHDDDAKELADLKLLIASKHYERTDLDLKFDKMEDTFRRGFDDMGKRFDRMSEKLMDFITKDPRKPQ
ncbi:MAG TPA: hypothetical protein VMW50_12095 [Dehalococcoidia bacterium]|nr:hypothetical protein [Dehalococcoidia bacterium]